MPTRKAKASWKDTLKSGKGELSLGSGAFEGPYSFDTRFGSDQGTNPEEMLGAAEAGCFSMALAMNLEKAGYRPRNLETKADVHLEKKDGSFRIANIELHCTGKAEGISSKEFEKIARETSDTCVISRALGGTEISVRAELQGS